MLVAESCGVGGAAPFPSGTERITRYIIKKSVMKEGGWARPHHRWKNPLMVLQNVL